MSATRTAGRTLLTVFRSLIHALVRCVLTLPQHLIKWTFTAFISTGTVSNPPLTPNPVSWDIHVYQTPGKQYPYACHFSDLTTMR